MTSVGERTQGAADDAATEARREDVTEGVRHINLTEAAGRFFGSHAARTVLYVYVLTRLMVFAILIIGGQVNRVVVGSDQTTRDMFLSVGKIPISRVLRDRVQTADVNWYHSIVAEGYEKKAFDAEKPHNWAFFPAFPLVWRAAAALTGERVVTGILLSNLLFLFALFAVYTAARDFGLDETATERALFYLAAFPFSHFFSLPLTESFFLLLAAGSFCAAKRGMWWLAGLLGGVASGTRVVGIILLPALALLYFQTYGRGWRRRSLLWLALIPSGLLAFMYYLYVITGNALAFKDVLVPWGRKTGFFLTTLLGYLREPLMIIAPWDFRLLNFLAPTLALVCGVVLAKRRQWAYAALTILTVVAALSSSMLQSQARYAMVVFPMYFIVAEWVGARPRLDLTLRAVSLALLALMTALFVARFTIAMA